MAEPVDLIFYNKVMDRIAIKQIISRLILHFGITYTTHVLDQLKTLGFQQATFSAISLGIDDLLTAPSKGWLIKDAEQYSNLSEKHHNYGNLHAVEKLRQLIETWYATSEYLKQEMNPNFRMTDPSNPVHMMSFPGARGSTSQVHQLVGMRGLMSDPQGQIIDLPIQNNFREGLSLTEYIISCYGARKGIVDTAVRTSDAGYLTRRLVEVVQRIVVRKKDCGTLYGIFINNYEGKKNNFYQKLIGRVLAENVYINNRCFATRNQDIGNFLANKFTILKTKLIYVRSPLTCKSMLWICQLCYGRNLTNGNLIEIGEAVGIIAGQSIGEPGTQLTLRTFHTGGVFAGDIAEHVRTPFNGIIKFDESFVYPTRTRHGHPAWICHTNLFLSIRSNNKVDNLIIPPKSLLLVQNSQYVESKQVIAEIRAKTSPFKEKIRKYIYSNFDGEMYWITKVRHASEYIHNSIHSILKTCHIWILSGKSYNKNPKLFVSFYENQDKIDSYTFLAKKKSFFYFIKNKNQLNICIFNLYIYKKNKVLKKWKFTHGVFNDLNNLVDSNIVLYNYEVIKKRRNFFLRKKYTNFAFFLKIKNHGILENNDFFAIIDHPKYELKKSGIVKYGTVKTSSTDRVHELKNAKTKIFQSRFKVVKSGNCFLIPEDVYVSTQALSSLLIKNNKIIQVGMSITSTITSSISGLVKIQKKKNNTYEVKILPGTIYYPNETYKISKQVSFLIPPGKKLFKEFQCNNWTYFQWIIPFEEKPFALLRPAIEYIVYNESNKKNLLNLLEKNLNLKINIVNYFLYGDGEQIKIVNEKCIRLIRTYLIIYWRKNYFSEKTHVSFLRIKTKNNSRNFLQFSLINSFCLEKKEQKKISHSQYLLKKNHYKNSFLTCQNQLKNKDKGIIRFSSNKKNENQPLILLSPSDSIKISKKVESKDSIIKNINNFFSIEFFDFCEHPRNSKFKNRSKDLDSIQKKSLLLEKKESVKRIFLFDKIGLIGNLRNLTNVCEYLYWITHAKIILNIVLIINQFRNPKWYFFDEYNEIHQFTFEKKINHNLFKWCFPLFRLLEEKHQKLNIGQFFFDNFCISKYKKIIPSGQIIGIHTDYLVIRSGKPYLASKGAIIHSNCGGSVKEGDTLITLIYERLKSADIIQGLPKVEQLLEARSVNSVSINLENSFGDWNNDMKKFIGYLWGFFLSAKIGMEQGQIILVDQIQKVYQSQGVYVSNKHIEIIVRQMTSKFLTLENGIINIFLPGELLESSRVQKMNRILEEAIPYEPILLGITKASLNTQSFISEASFQETTRVLAKAALKGRIDWLKGLKENVIIGEIIPAGTGSQEVLWQRILEKKKEIFLRKKKNSFNKKIKNIFLYRNILNVSPAIRTVHNVLKESASKINRNISSI
uniref:RNA polymerase beta'' subunit n=1 Tax=Pleurozia subinflata TaxID=2945675 RepID=UPI0026E3E45E|nr:RNA polymerase beta'' subunit [Pleurozia subinflata]URH13426.1 RNA polymerase beta'' subunit [Pleurozia subinflata]